MKPELYSSIREIPLFNWEQLNLTSDFKFLIKEKTHRFKSIKPDEIELAYFSLHDEYAEASGGGDKMEKLWVLMNERIKARILVGKGDMSQMNWVNAYTIDIEELMKPDENYDPVKSRMKIQKLYGLPIEPKKITLYEYLMICKVVEDEVLANNNAHNGKGK